MPSRLAGSIVAMVMTTEVCVIMLVLKQHMVVSKASTMITMIMMIMMRKVTCCR